MLEIRNLSYGYSENDKLIDNLSISFETKKKYLITGKSGCGKSTLGYILSGLSKVEVGEVLYNKVHIDNIYCSMMFQNPNLQFCMDTVFNELIFVLENMSVPKVDMEEKVNEALIFVDMIDYKHRVLNTLSGGEKQKIALACVYLLDRDILILDEPFASVDEKTAKLILNKIYKLQEKREFTLIIIDHLLNFYEDNIDAYYIFKNKKITTISYNELLRVFDYKEQEKLIFPVKGTILKIENLTIEFDKKSIIKNYNLILKRNDMLCLLGDSGSGKSTILNAIIGLVKYKGQIIINEKNIKNNTQKIGFLFQNPMDQFIYPRVYDEVFNTCKDENISEEILKYMGLWEYKDLSPFKLSQGQQRRLALAILFSIKHDLLILDEPTYGQDKENSIKIMNMIVEYINKYEPATIFTSHDSFIVENYATIKKGIEK